MNDYLKCHHCKNPLVKEEAAFCGTYYAHVSCKLQHEKRELSPDYEMTAISAHIATLPKDSQDSILKSYEIDWGND